MGLVIIAHLHWFLRNLLLRLRGKTQLKRHATKCGVKSAS